MAKTAVRSEGLLAIDPGLRGAVALMIDGAYHIVADLPIAPKRSGKNELDPKELFIMLNSWGNDFHCRFDYCLIESVASRPGQGVSSMFKFGDAFGCCRAIATVVCQRVEFVTASQWKGVMKLNKEKKYSLSVARKRYPQAREALVLEKHEGRAEAILLAEYAIKHHDW